MLKEYIQNNLHRWICWIGTLLNHLIGHGRQRKCLLILRTDGIGDFVLFGPMIATLAERYPGHELLLLLQARVAELADAHPDISKLITFNYSKYRKNIFYRLKTLWYIRQKKVAICINPMVSRDWIGDEIVLWSNAGEKIGWDTIFPSMSLKQKKQGDHYYTRLIKTNLMPYAHELNSNKLFLHDTCQQDADFRMAIWPAPQHIKNVATRWKDARLENSKVICLSIGALASYRKWAIENYFALIERIRNYSQDHKFIIIGETDKTIIDKIVAYQKREPDIFNWCGTTALGELSAIFKHCQMVIGNESGPMHIAVAVNVPTVCILGGGHYGRFMPYGNEDIHKYVIKKMDCFQCNWKCKYNSVRCIAEIPIAAVYAEVIKLLAQLELK